MRIYWICMDSSDPNCDPLSRLMAPERCFFRMTPEEANHEVEFRWSNEGMTYFYYQWEDVPDELFGECINEHRPMLPDTPDCSVGMVRKMRNGVENDDGTCRTCPYYRDEHEPDEGAFMHGPWGLPVDPEDDPDDNYRPY